MKRRNLLITIAWLSVILVGLIIVAVTLPESSENPTLQTGPAGTTGSTQPSETMPEGTTPSTQPTEPSTQPTEPTEPPVRKETTATIGATGDILLHEKVLRSAYDPDTKTFDFRYIFEHFGDYASGVDYAVANLEVTLRQKSGTGLNGYNGYPCFNAPDEIVDALKDAGFDMLLTANNHSYDSGHKGLLRTPQAIRDKGLANIGTRLNTEEKRYKIVDVNGIRIGMINYTYNTDLDSDGSIALNGISLSVEDSELVNSFNYWELDKFYAQLQTQLDAMRDEGAEAIVLYIHWGDEYNTTPNSWQKKMAQELCNMGIDVIVGNHAHVPQPVELLTNENDETQKTLCLYSTGNAVSNISRDSTNRPVNTEDGMLFTFTFAKYSDGTVVLESTDVLPTWVWRHDTEQGIRMYTILTMDDSIADWKAHLGISDEILKECQDSYDRTMGIVGGGLAEANAWFAEKQTETEALLGVK